MRQGLSVVGLAIVLALVAPPVGAADAGKWIQLRLGSGNTPAMVTFDAQAHKLNYGTRNT